jgi:hypothetical protein
MKKDSAYAKNLCVGFGRQLKQVLLKLIDPNPNTRLSLDQFLSDEWFTRHTPRESHDINKDKDLLDYFSTNTYSVELNDYTDDY